LIFKGFFVVLISPLLWRI